MQLILKMAAMINAAQVKLDELSATMAEFWRLVTPATIMDCIVKCCFSAEQELRVQ
jgi:hypothetical protein